MWTDMSILKMIQTKTWKVKNYLKILELLVTEGLHFKAWPAFAYYLFNLNFY